MPIYADTTNWPPCTQQGCTIDSFGVLHGYQCARAKASEAAVEEWKAQVDAEFDAHETHHEHHETCTYCRRTRDT